MNLECAFVSLSLLRPLLDFSSCRCSFFFLRTLAAFAYWTRAFDVCSPERFVGALLFFRLLSPSLSVRLPMSIYILITIFAYFPGPLRWSHTSLRGFVYVCRQGLRLLSAALVIPTICNYSSLWSALHHLADMQTVTHFLLSATPY